MHELALFSGIGGISHGLRQAIPNLKTVCHVERDPYAVGVLISRMAQGDLDSAPIWDDVCSFDGKPWRGVVDLISGGFPCQDISFAGKGAGIVAGQTRSGLWHEFARIIGEVRPSFVFVENVAALLVRGIGIVLGQLSELGYDAKWGVVSAAAAGAAHKRERVFILAYAAQLVGDERKHREYSTEREIQLETGGSGSDVANSTSQRFCDQKNKPIVEKTGGGEFLFEQPGDSTRQAQPFLGGATDGFSTRLDTLGVARPGEDPHDWEAPRTTTESEAWRAKRLKCLGNAVVPQAVALAARQLFASLYA